MEENIKMANSATSADQKVAPRSVLYEIPKNIIAKYLCFGIPAALLIGAYLHMAMRYNKIWLFDTIVHERGKYTLLEVILYFRHFIWELPIKTVYALFIVGAFYFFGNKGAVTKDTGSSYISLHKIVISGILALVVGLTAFLMTANTYGFVEAFTGLLQSRISEIKPLTVGSHWRNHFLSNIVMYASTISVILMYRIYAEKGKWGKRRFSFLLPLTIMLFILITFIFGINLDPFNIPSYLGHQLREVFGSDLTITMLLSLGILIHLEGRYDTGKTTNRMNNDTKKPRQTVVCFLISSIIAISLSLFLIIKVLATDISSEMAKLGSTAGWSKMDLFAWHFFEHSLDYIYTGCLVYFLYLLTLKIERGKRFV